MRGVLTTGLAVALATGCAGADASGSPTGEPSTDRATAEVRRTDLTETLTEVGRLEYAEASDLATGLTGTVTWTPSPGDVVTEGEPVYRVDSDPVLRLDGSVPAWRDLDAGTSRGSDVRQLEEALERLGYAEDLDMEVDGEWTWVTTVAVERWQGDHGLEEDGSLPLGRVVFTPGDVRVAAVLAPEGTLVQPGSPVLSVGATARSVNVPLDPGRQDVAPVGGEVELRFPDGTTARGRIAAVRNEPADEASEESLTVSVEVVGSRAARARVGAQVDGTSVQVGFSRTVAQGVLAVPVTALVALVDGGYGVEEVAEDGTTSYVPVRTGAFSETLVEVESPDLAAGDVVVVTP